MVWMSSCHMDGYHDVIWMAVIMAHRLTLTIAMYFLECRAKLRLTNIIGKDERIRSMSVAVSIMSCSL